MEAFAPFTLVNGKVWPVLDVQPDHLPVPRPENGSNARTLPPRPAPRRRARSRSDRPDRHRSRPAESPRVRTGERPWCSPRRNAPICLSTSPTLEAWYRAHAAQHGSCPVRRLLVPGGRRRRNAADLDGLLPYPHVMRFPRRGGASQRRGGSPVSSQQTTSRPARTNSPERRVARSRSSSESSRTNPTCSPCAKARACGRRVRRPGRNRRRRRAGPPATRRRGRPLRRHHDVSSRCSASTRCGGSSTSRTTRTRSTSTSTRSRFSRDRRPRREIPEDGIEDHDLAATVTLERGPDDALDHAIDDNERGLKDTVRVNPGEIVEIAVRFTTYSGRYMYHCHILEHEDRDMMRPFVTMPMELMPFMS